MDFARFDRLVQTLARSGTRRRALALALAGGLLPAAASAAPEPTRCLAIGKRCSFAATERHRRKRGKHHRPSCARCCSRFGAANADGKARCACKPEGEACDNASQCCGGRCRDGSCTVCGAGSKPCQGACIPETACCADVDGTACGTGGLCDDGRCFLAYPNCEGNCGTFGVAAGSGGVNFCTSSGQLCSGPSCNQTADCPAGQWCEVVFECGNRCVDGCPA